MAVSTPEYRSRDQNRCPARSKGRPGKLAMKKTHADTPCHEDLPHASGKAPITSAKALVSGMLGKGNTSRGAIPSCNKKI